MVKRTLLVALLLTLFAFGYPYALTQPAQAASDCEILQGIPNGPTSAPPPPCLGGVGVEGINYPANLKCKSDGYCQMPVSSVSPPKEPYTIYACTGQRYGHRDLVGVLNTVAQRWKQKYPNGKVWIGDLNASGHKSHNIGRAVDVQAATGGSVNVAKMDSGSYDYKATIEFGKMFIDTNIILHIWYNDPKVNSEVVKYARDTGRSPAFFDGQHNNYDRPGMRPQPGHEDHFHVDVKLPKELSFWEPGC